MISPIIRCLLEKRLGHAIRYPSDCTALAIDISNVTGQRVGITTLKRIFGFVHDVAAPRLITLDILAQYLGYNDFNMLLADVGDDSDILPLEPKSVIVSEGQKAGTVLKISLPCPAHSFVVEYAGRQMWKVVSSSLPLLIEGDLLRIPVIVGRQVITVIDVIRNGNGMGPLLIGARHGCGAVESKNGKSEQED